MSRILAEPLPPCLGQLTTCHLSFRTVIFSYHLRMESLFLGINSHMLEELGFPSNWYERPSTKLHSEAAESISDA